MEIAKLLGYTKSSTHYDASEEESVHDSGGTRYIFYIELNGKYFTFNALYSYGSCYSGYCGASWGSIDPELDACELLPTDLISTNKEIFIYAVDGRVRTAIQDQEFSYDATIEQVNSIDGTMILNSTGDGGCEYYSSGNVNINEELFV
jgi:hypothetical protein